MSNQAQQNPTIDISGVKPADIIVTRAYTTNSQVIRYGSCSSYSHAILALGNGDCIDAMPAGVQIRPLDVALSKSSHATLLRHVSIDPNYAGWICHFAKEYNGRPYDVLGAARSGIDSGCGIAKHTTIGRMIVLADEQAKKSIHDESFFCSELIVRAFDEGCLQVVRDGAHTASPGAVATSPYLRYVKELITT